MDYIEVDGEQVPVPDGTPDAALPGIAARHRAKKDMAGRDPLTRAAMGFAAPLAEVAQGVKQLVQGKDFNADYIEQVRAAREGAGTAGTVGELAAFALPGGASTKVAGKVISRALPRALAASAGEQGLYEGLRATREGETRAGNLAQGALWGAAGGGLGHALPGALSRVAKPVTASAPVQAVVDQFRRAGMAPQLTVGQAVNGVVNKVEQALTSMPGTSVRNARENALTEWNRAQLVNASKDARRIAEERLAEINAGQANPALRATVDDLAPALTARDIPRAGHRGIEALQQQKNALYDAGLRGNVVAALPTDTPFTATDSILSRLTPDDAAKVTKARDNLFADLQSGGVRDDKIKEIDSELRQQAEKAFRDGQYELGRAYEALHGDYRKVMSGFMYPKDLAKLTQADALYANLVPMQNAAARQGALTRGGVFTPSQQLSEIRAANPKSTLAGGRARGQQGAEAAQQVYGDLPNSGTADRLLGNVLVGGGAAALTDQLLTGEVNPGSTAGFAAPAIAGLLLGRPSLARAAIGETDWQRALQRSPAWAKAVAQANALRGPTRAAAARLAQEQEDERRKRRGY